MHAAPVGTLVFHADSVADTDDEEQAGENSDSRKNESQADPVGHDRKDEWSLAVRFRDIQRYGYLEPKQKKEMSEQAIYAVMLRAREMLGPVQKPYRYLHVSGENLAAHEARGAFAEMDIEETLSNQELVYQVRLEKDHGLVLVLDTSLSMKGEKLALLGVTVAAVAMSLPREAFAILGFDSEVHTIKSFQENLSTEALIERVLSIPPGGFTNIELGLKTAEEWIRASAFRQSRVILVSDGRYTEGKNPVEIARGLPFVYTVKIGKDPSGRQVMRDISDTGLGRFTEVREMVDLPKVLLHAVRSWVK